MTTQDKKTLRALLEGFTEFREDGFGSQLWLHLDDYFLDHPIAEDTRYEREGNRLTAYKLNVGSLHWYVSGKYELR